MNNAELLILSCDTQINGCILVYCRYISSKRTARLWIDSDKAINVTLFAGNSYFMRIKKAGDRNLISSARKAKQSNSLLLKLFSTPSFADFILTAKHIKALESYLNDAGLRLYDLLESSDTEALSPILGDVASICLCHAFKQRSLIQEAITLLINYGLSRNEAYEFIKFYGSESVNKFNENPLRVLSFIRPEMDINIYQHPTVLNSRHLASVGTLLRWFEKLGDQGCTVVFDRNIPSRFSDLLPLCIERQWLIKDCNKYQLLSHFLIESYIRNKLESLAAVFHRSFLLEETRIIYQRVSAFLKTEPAQHYYQLIHEAINNKTYCILSNCWNETLNFTRYLFPSLALTNSIEPIIVTYSSRHAKTVTALTSFAAIPYYEVPLRNDINPHTSFIVLDFDLYSTNDLNYFLSKISNTNHIITVGCTDQKTGDAGEPLRQFSSYFPTRALVSETPHRLIPASVPLSHLDEIIDQVKKLQPCIVISDNPKLISSINSNLKTNNKPIIIHQGETFGKHDVIIIDSVGKRTHDVELCEILGLHKGDLFAKTGEQFLIIPKKRVISSKINLAFAITLEQARKIKIPKAILVTNNHFNISSFLRTLSESSNIIEHISYIEGVIAAQTLNVRTQLFTPQVE